MGPPNCAVPLKFHLVSIYFKLILEIIVVDLKDINNDVLTFISKNPNNNINLHVVIKVHTQQETRTS